MKTAGVLFGLLVLAGAGYAFLLMAQTNAAVALCDEHEPGMRISDINAIKKTSLLSRRGPMIKPQQDETVVYIYCVSAAMCDIACMLEITDGVLTDVTYRDQS